MYRSLHQLLYLILMSCWQHFDCFHFKRHFLTIDNSTSHGLTLHLSLSSTEGPSVQREKNGENEKQSPVRRKRSLKVERSLCRGESILIGQFKWKPPKSCPTLSTTLSSGNSRTDAALLSSSPTKRQSARGTCSVHVLLLMSQAFYFHTRAPYIHVYMYTCCERKNDLRLIKEKIPVCVKLQVILEKEVFPKVDLTEAPDVL